MSHTDEQNTVEEHMHHHHHSSSHGGKKRRSGRHGSRKFQKFWKKYGKLLTCIGIVILVLALFAIVSVFEKLDRREEPSQTPKKDTVDEGVKVTTSSICIEAPIFPDEIVLITRNARLMTERDMSFPLSEVIDRYKDSDERLDKGRAVEIAFDVTGLPAGYSVRSAKIEVSEDAAFSSSRTAMLGNEKYAAAFYHLKTGTRYYYRISVTLSDSTTTSVQGSFVTADTPRILSVDGAVNVRDIGGWETVDGRHIRQGLLYRGSELDGAVEPAFSLTQSGREDMLTVLGIRTDMDLRSPTDHQNSTNALGANVEHIYYDAPMYAGAFTDTDPIRAVFSDLADKSRYPVYLHCTYGRDRTGTVCCLLEALLGMAEEDLLREYELTALYYGEVPSGSMEAFLTELKSLEGDTVQEQAENYLLSIGITAEEIASIKEIFLE